MFSWFGKVSFVPFSKVSDFAVHLKEGRLMGSRCKKCGYKTFPPRADCPQCMSDAFEFVEYNGKGTVHTFSTIAAAPTGFEDLGSYTTVVVDLEQGGRLLGWLGETVPLEQLKIGMDVQVVPRLLEESEQIKVFYTIDRPGTTWGRQPAPHLG